MTVDTENLDMHAIHRLLRDPFQRIEIPDVYERCRESLLEYVAKPRRWSSFERREADLLRGLEAAGKVRISVSADTVQRV